MIHDSSSSLGSGCQFKFDSSITVGTGLIFIMATPNFVIVSDEDLNELLSDSEAANTKVIKYALGRLEAFAKCTSTSVEELGDPGLLLDLLNKWSRLGTIGVV